MRPQHRKAIAVWLLVVCAMVFAMIVIGGVTRLTHSGLSMVEWRPVTGWLPPLGEAEWGAVFDQYKGFPEFSKLNGDMTLSEFKSIFWVEYVHRLWGRIIGLAFFVPFVIFGALRWIDGPMAVRLLLMFALGGLQGFLGWYMVKSGLVDDPDVSPYRLTAHLGLAFAILGFMLWTAMSLLNPRPHSPRAGGRRIRGMAVGLSHLVLITILSGGFVAGIGAGFAYNTFPLMEGQLLPDGLFALEPFQRNFFEDITTVQFEHRLLALLVLAGAMAFWMRARGFPLSGRARMAVNTVFLAALIQVSLGIATLVLSVPVHLAASHQAGAVVLFSAALWTVHELRGGAS